MDCHYTERGALTREGLSNLIQSVLTQVLTWFRRSVGLSALAATLSRALLVDAPCLELVGG